MTGFLIGVAVVLVLDELAPLVGFSPQGANEIIQFFALLTHPSQFSVPTILTGSLALGLMIVLSRTRLAPLASLAALVVPSLFVTLLGWQNVLRVADINPIPRGIPIPALPNFSLVTPELLMAALSIAIVIAIQGAGVSQTVENPDGSPINPSVDMVAQGVGNIMSGILSGIPAGGSVGQTALNVSVGARSRWAGVMGGVWMLVIILVIPGIVSQVPMTVLAALMIMAGFSAIDFREARSIWNTGGPARWSILVTFLATLLLSIPIAVMVGVLVSVVLNLLSASSDVVVRVIIPQGEGRYTEGPPPARLSSNTVMVLQIYGSLFFAGARTLMEALPSPTGATDPVVVLRLRGRTHIGATLVEVLDTYADALADVGGRLYLSGVTEPASKQLRSVGKLDLDNAVQLVPAEAVLGESTRRAVESANAWLGSARNNTQLLKNK
jgi:SulP family sulfate permease